MCRISSTLNYLLDIFKHFRFLPFENILISEILIQLLSFLYAVFSLKIHLVLWNVILNACVIGKPRTGRERDKEATSF